MDGLTMKYFTLKPAGDDIYAAASRRAMRQYANMIERDNPRFAADLRSWADREWEAAVKRGAFDEKSAESQGL